MFNVNVVVMVMVVVALFPENVWTFSTTKKIYSLDYPYSFQNSRCGFLFSCMYFCFVLFVWLWCLPLFCTFIRNFNSYVLNFSYNLPHIICFYMPSNFRNLWSACWGNALHLIETNCHTMLFRCYIDFVVINNLFGMLLLCCLQIEKIKRRFSVVFSYLLLNGHHRISTKGNE